jgi:hypothetical protein
VGTILSDLLVCSRPSSAFQSPHSNYSRAIAPVAKHKAQHPSLEETTAAPPEESRAACYGHFPKKPYWHRTCNLRYAPVMEISHFMEKRRGTVSTTRLIRPRTVAIALLVLTIGSITYAFAAANVVPETGDGTGTVSGYTVSNITYTPLSSDPTKLEQVSMDVAATTGADAPNDVRITVDGGSTWATCSGPSRTTWTCTFSIGSEPSVSSVSNLQVVAAQ